MQNAIYFLWRVKPRFTLIALTLAAVSFAQPNPLAEINTDQVKLRACSGLSCRVMGLLRAGQRCEVLRTESLEEIGAYGINTWAEVIVGNQRGYVYSALLRLLPEERELVRLRETAQVKEGHANVRACPNRRCDILFQLPVGSSCQVSARTDFLTFIAGQQDGHHWYFIEYQGKTGFIHGSILDFNANTGNRLSIQAERAEVYNGSRQAIAIVDQGQSFPVIRQSDASERIRPYGRHYWYLIGLGSGRQGWVYGAFTDRAGAPVDCQCVDYVKHALDISGPTKNAFEWPEVLLGQIQVTIEGAPGYLRFREVIPPEQAQAGDLAVFDKAHPQAHPDYGHIGFVSRLEAGPDGLPQRVEIDGGNHQVPIEEYYIDYRCNNVSKKWYSAGRYVRFFRLN